MPKRNHTALKDELATHIAGGGSVKSFADKHAMSPRTAYSWSASDEVKTLVREFRSKLNQQTLGILTAASVKAAARLVKLLDSPESESTQLQAAKAVLASKSALDHEDFESRLAALEAKAEEAKPKHRRIAG